MTTKSKSAFQSDLPIPPGELLDEELTTLGVTRRALARRTGYSIRAIDAIIAGETPITNEIALQLERVLGISAGLWSRLEAQYTRTKALSLGAEPRSG